MKSKFFILVLCSLVFACKKKNTTPDNGFTYNSFSQSDINKINVIGSAYFSDSTNMLVLNDAIPDAAHHTTTGTGHAYYKQLLEVANGFETTFSFSIADLGGIYDGDGNNGGDGISFTLFNSDTTLLRNYVWYQNIHNSLSIEFDTYYNGNVDDPNGNHIAMYAVTDSNSYTPYNLAMNSAVADFSSQGTHTVKIVYKNKNMKVYLDGVVALDVDVDLSTVLSLENGKAYVDLGSFSGSSFETHGINNWSFTSN